MKIRTREINTVSMSALDMFCSALGAFMFLTILFFAFVPNLGPKAADLAKMMQDLEQARQQLAKAEQAREQAQQQLQKMLDQQATDIVIVIDASGSMETQLRGLSNDISDFSIVLGNFTRKARIGIIAYRDLCYPSGAIETLPLTLVDQPGIQRIKTFADSLHAISDPCNDTYEEALFTGLDTATKLQWTATDKQRFIVVIGDQAAHPEERQSAQNAARGWAAKGSRISTLRIVPSPLTGREADAKLFYDELARDGGGVALDPGGSFALSLLKAMSQ